ncbi:RNA polymerase subunit sigma-70 [Pedobacter yulinensis]|uniref:RNA polymerase subunit sigma-70 n=1 Tax=Pedobacter yulinensis TaxID=2126353 RepID=A0A2T3HKE7_9SPHI|nr:sigma-70 family RNA polymerase sigma factor [Pedobacter yulinensis]PST82900.1 RNA polymerase subunit sigma-70 [Pedobacter yulinensis]
MYKALNSSLPTDREVVLGILNNSDETLNKLYRGYFPMILQFILNNNGNEDDAKDVFQESVIVLYNKIKAGDFELSSKLKTYIYSVCRRIWLKRLAQDHKKTNNINDYEDVLIVDDDLEKHDEQDRRLKKMNEALEGLGEPCKTIIQDFYLNNLSMQDISEKFGYTNTDNAKTQKYKCLQRLKKIFFNG